MKTGDMYYVGSTGSKGNYRGWPVLIVYVDNHHRVCYGLCNGEIRWYRQHNLRSKEEDEKLYQKRNEGDC